MDLFDLGEGYNTLDEGMSRIKCPVLVRQMFYYLLLKNHELIILILVLGNTRHN
jgi:hypothetical protein